MMGILNFKNGHYIVKHGETANIVKPATLIFNIDSSSSMNMNVHGTNRSRFHIVIREIAYLIQIRKKMKIKGDIVIIVGYSDLAFLDTDAQKIEQFDIYDFIKRTETQWVRGRTNINAGNEAVVKCIERNVDLVKFTNVYNFSFTDGYVNVGVLEPLKIAALNTINIKRLYKEHGISQIFFNYALSSSSDIKIPKALSESLCMEGFLSTYRKIGDFDFREFSSELGIVLSISSKSVEKYFDVMLLDGTVKRVKHILENGWTYVFVEGEIINEIVKETDNIVINNFLNIVSKDWCYGKNTTEEIKLAKSFLSNMDITKQVTDLENTGLFKSEDTVPLITMISRIFADIISRLDNSNEDSDSCSIIRRFSVSSENTLKITSRFKNRYDNRYSVDCLLGKLPKLNMLKLRRTDSSFN
jgi:hypothetical protein